MVMRRMSFVLVFLLTFAMLLPGCTSELSSTTATSTTTEKPTTTAPAATEAPPAKIGIFYFTGGLTMPNDIDYKANDFFAAICKAANVEAVEVEVPPFADVKTKFNLMMSSGNIPDLVHYNNFAEMSQYGIDGAFTEMSDIIKNSASLSKLYTQPMIEAMKASDGKVYTLRSLPTRDGWHLTARLDILTEIGYGEKLPSTLDEWIDAMNKSKEKYPDSIPYTSMGVDNYHQLIFEPFGCESGWGWQYIGGKVANTFENPNLNDAILFGKKLLSEGLMDKEFATNKLADYNTKKFGSNALVASMNIGSIGATIETYAKNNVDKAVIIPVKWPYVNESSLDPYTKYVPERVIANHCISISSKTKQIEAAVRFIETLLSDEIKELIVYGREGIEYTIKDGKKVYDAAKQAKTGWRNMYGMMFSYNPMEKIELKVSMGIAVTNISDDDKAKYQSTFDKYFSDIISTTYGKITYAPVETAATSMLSLITLTPDLDSLTKEAISQQKSILLKALMGEISMDEFTKQAADLVKKYQPITDDFNKKLPEVKAKYDIG